MTIHNPPVPTQNPEHNNQSEVSPEKLRKVIDLQKLELKNYKNMVERLSLNNSLLGQLVKKVSETSKELINQIETEVEAEASEELKKHISRLRKEKKREINSLNAGLGEDKMRLQEHVAKLEQENDEISHKLDASNGRLLKLEKTLLENGIEPEGEGEAVRARLKQVAKDERDKVINAFDHILKAKQKEKEELRKQVVDLENTLQAQKKGMIQSDEHRRDVQALYNRLDQVQSLQEELRAQKKPRPDIEITDDGDVITKLSSVGARPDIEITDDGDVVTKLSSVSHISKSKQEKGMFDTMMGGIKRFWKRW